VAEESLIEAVLDGDPRAERALYDAHVDRVFRLAHRLTGDAEQARELTQSVFIRVFDRLHQFRRGSALSTWIYRVAFSVIHSELRRGRARAAATIPLRAADLTTPPPDGADPRLVERVRQAIDALPDRRRVVFVMHDLEGYTHGEIGEVLEIAEGTSRAHLHRARAELRAALEEYAEEVP
jgi:RNA polymerase sigma-70 factor, ECF subfamily